MSKLFTRAKPEAITDQFQSNPGSPFPNRYPIVDEVQPITKSTPSSVNNDNRGEGMLNHVTGTQNNSNQTETYGGDNFNGTISGGNVGGRGNTNTIHDNRGPSGLLVPPLLHAASLPADLPRRAPPVFRGDYAIYGMEMELYTLEEGIEEILNAFRWDTQRKLQAKIEFARRMQEELKAAQAI
ncbi:hypothetical protein ONZ45_g3058 [Pleurotus djamor]|nr:hypothetical protein ONZ45_g16303 [Pleurotus djamor]KAJ8520053.1 hypothetical protein ONZ45_g3058 [Pleurotus djamor]